MPYHGKGLLREGKIERPQLKLPKVCHILQFTSIRTWEELEQRVTVLRWLLREVWQWHYRPDLPHVMLVQLQASWVEVACPLGGEAKERVSNIEE